MSFITKGDGADRDGKVNIALFGPAGIGKTSQLKTLDPKKTLLIDLEAGEVAITGHPVDRIRVMEVAQKMGVHPWKLAQAIACLIAGPDPTDEAISPDGIRTPGPYSVEAYEAYAKQMDPAMFEQYDTLFIDSLTVVSRWSFHYTQRHDPDAFSEKTGRPDTRGAYGAHGRGVVHWLTTLQHQRKYNVVVVGILNEIKDDLGRVTMEPQLTGSMIGKDLPGIFDEVVSMVNLRQEDGTAYRAFICHQDNPYAVPAKDRSGCLELVEKPHLGELISKVQGGKRLDNELVTALPEEATAADEPVAAGFVPHQVPAAQPAPTQE